MKQTIINRPGYKLPKHLSPFQEAMYIHLINWKRKFITEEPGEYIFKGKIYKYDAILLASVHEKFPIIYPKVVEKLKDHCIKFPFKLHKHFNHMASSQAANVNLFLPILFNKNADHIFSKLKPDFKCLAANYFDNGFRIEYWDGNSNSQKGLLGDHSAIAGTDSDIAIAYYNQENELCLWLIEHKLTETEFTKCGGAKSKGRKPYHNCNHSFSELIKHKDYCYYHSGSKYKYWEITEKHQSYYVNHDHYSSCPFEGGLNQLWRNQLLGFALENLGEFKQVYFSVVHHPENTALNDSIVQYIRLTNNSPKFSVFTSADFLAASHQTGDVELLKWEKWYREFYNVK